jgi:hypothetical protein
MRSFIKTIVAILGIMSLVILVFLSAITFLFLNPNFYISSLAKPGVYKNIEKGLKASARDTLRAQLTGENLKYDQLTVGERTTIDSQIENFIAPVNEKNIQDITEKNVVLFLNYINGKSEKLIIYLPLSKWNLPSETLQKIPNYLKTENLDILKIKEENPDLNINSESILALKGLGLRIKFYWIGALVITIMLFLIHLAIGDSKFRFVKTGRVITGGGIILLFLSWVIKIFQNTFGQNIASRSQASDILAGTILSALLDSVYKLFLGCAIFLILFGLIMFNIKPKNG